MSMTIMGVANDLDTYLGFKKVRLTYEFDFSTKPTQEDILPELEDQTASDEEE
jgi:hypothetical protein